MQTNVIYEQPLLSYHGCWIGDHINNDLEIYMKDLEQAKIGDRWAITDQDQYPNANNYWEVTYELVYKNDDGYAVLYTSELYPDSTELHWIQKGKK